MLRSLRITNFVLIEDNFIEFHPGLNVLTGETGAGKSVIIDALSLLLGERSSAGLIKDIEKDAIIEAVFEFEPDRPASNRLLACLDEAGLSLEDDTLIITRRIAPNGKSRTFVNQSQCLLKVLKNISEFLVDLHGQHEHQSLLNKSSYMQLLDEYGNCGQLLEKYQTSYQQWKDCHARLETFMADTRERKRQEEMLRHQRDEIDSAELSVDEDETLQEKLNVLQHAERLSERCQEILNGLNESPDGQAALLDQLEHFELTLSEMSQLDKSLSNLLESFQNATISLKETSRELESYAHTLEFDPTELEQMQERRFLIKDLKSKYGSTIREILSFRDELETQLNQIENFDETLAALQKEEEKLKQTMIQLGKDLHKTRERAAKQIAKRVCAELKTLNMAQASFAIEVTYKISPDGIENGGQRLNYGPSGTDDIEFMIQTIPDKPMRPLREVASGGEISRIMLALKCTFGEADPVPTMIFDEIDTGVGGKTADAVADRLSALARNKQIICITHLPQIASHADLNLLVEKCIQKDHIQSRVTALKQKERETELARMLGGEDSATSKKFARELLKASRK